MASPKLKVVTDLTYFSHQELSNSVSILIITFCNAAQTVTTQSQLAHPNTEVNFHSNIGPAITFGQKSIHSMRNLNTK